MATKQLGLFTVTSPAGLTGESIVVHQHGSYLGDLADVATSPKTAVVITGLTEDEEADLVMVTAIGEPHEPVEEGARLGLFYRLLGREMDWIETPMGPREGFGWSGGDNASRGPMGTVQIPSHSPHREMHIDAPSDEVSRRILFARRLPKRTFP